MTLDRSSPERRLLFLAATSKDAESTRAVLAPAGIHVDSARTIERLLQEMSDGVGALLLTEESISQHAHRLIAWLAVQPPWSDLPVLVLTRQGADSRATEEAVRTLGNVTLLERPVRIVALMSAVRTAIRARDRQYQIREHLAERARSELSLRRADQRKDEFLATLGHELRNPLSPLLAAVQLVRAAERTDPAITRLSGVMERQVHHLIRLVDDLLEVSRITRGLIEIRHDTVDLVAAVQAAVDTSRTSIDSGGHELVLTLPKDPAYVRGDAVRLTQIFANLLTNAAKYTNAGGRIEVDVRRQDGTAVVCVRDNGIGIAADQLTSIFDMFTQLDRSDRRSQGGLGIGLTLVKTLVEMHEGHVEARSAGLGRGSEFVVRLPVVGAMTSSQAESAAAAEFPHRRILIVDDNRDAAETLAELLTTLGAVTTVAQSGRAALAALDTFRPDAVLLDIGMPDMNGYEVARAIRASLGHADLLLIALTGWGQDQDRRQAARAGFDHHLVKPPDLEKLRALLLDSPRTP